jgi:hypothetical protein
MYGNNIIYKHLIWSESLRQHTYSLFILIFPTDYIGGLLPYTSEL